MSYAGLDMSPGNTGLVSLTGDGALSSYYHSSMDGTQHSFLSRELQALRIITEIKRLHLADSLSLLGIENYVLGTGQTSSYQIAEVGGIVKHELVRLKIPFVLIDQGKRSSYVARSTKQKVRAGDKKAIIAWANANGFPMKVAKRGEVPDHIRELRTGDSLKARPREDLADAFVIARMAHQLDAVEVFRHNRNLPAPKNDLWRGEKGLLNLPDALFNYDRKTR